MEAIAGGDDDDGRASKKVFNSNPCSSVHKVISNEDLLIEILLLLPLISLNLFKRVSKHWKAIITSPSFIFRRTQISGFVPPKSHHYKVVHVGDIRDPVAVYGHCIKIQTYSSETDVWTVWDDLLPLTSFTGFWNGIYSNGAIHWLNNRPGISYFKLEFVDRLVLTKIQTPLTLEGEMHDDHKLFRSYGSLLLVCKDHYGSGKLNIYEIKSGCSEWSIKYFVNLDNMLRRTWRLPKDLRCYNVWSIFCGEREEDSFMVIELSGKVLQYKFVSAAVTKLLDLGKGVGECDCHDFITSFAHV